jgi:hypothetical protein
MLVISPNRVSQAITLEGSAQANGDPKGSES